MLKKGERKKPNLKNRNLFFPIILILGIIYLFTSEVGILRWHHLKTKREQIQLEINRLIAEEKSLFDELERLKHDEEYIKKIAQERYQMVKPGEKVFRVIDKRNTDRK